jgi:hypothetical protein
MPAPLRKLVRLGARGWRDLLRAQVALLRAQRRLEREPIGALAIRENFTVEASTGDPARAETLAHAVHRAAQYGLFRPYCLVRAMALRDLLVADGIHGASIRIGVRRANGEFQAHAWIRWGERVLGDEARHVARFTEVDDLGVMRTR